MPVQQNNFSPGFMPILSAGRHRNPRKGGCFMEFASYLAGEKWSDHPRCTHPTLALLARLVNDCTSDRDRSELAELIPSVIGLTSDDPRIELRIALRAAAAALPVASEGRQRALAVGMIATQSRLALLEAGPEDSALAIEISSAFSQTPAAAAWAQTFLATNGVERADRTVPHVSESIIRTAVVGIAQACSPGTNQRLAAVLRSAIEDCRKIVDANDAARHASTVVASLRPREGLLPTR